MSQLTIADEIALYLGGGLVLLGTVGVGLLEIIAGSPHPVTGEGQVVHEALVPLHVRSYIILLGLVIWGAYAVFKVLATTPETGGTRRTL
ncbi:MAG: hypothetical protein ABEJ78_02685 [Haloferacaceae archaeon]